MCYHMFSRARSSAFAEFQVPELQRTPLEELCLQVSLLATLCSWLHSWCAATRRKGMQGCIMKRVQRMPLKLLSAQVKLLQGEHVGSVRIEQFLAQAMEAPAPQAVSQVCCTAVH